MQMSTDVLKTTFSRKYYHREKYRNFDLLALFKTNMQIICSLKP
jgi:hypothetical protein